MPKNASKMPPSAPAARPKPGATPPPIETMQGKPMTNMPPARARTTTPRPKRR